MVDTRHFDQKFIDDVLASFDDLDGVTDGLLVHGENWQTLNLLADRYHNSVEGIYIDPPYNTGDSEILYKNEYLHSSWLTMMENRITLGLDFLVDDPILFIAIDDFELVNICKLIDICCPSLSRNMIIVNQSSTGWQGDRFVHYP